jgi:serine/threonine protein kinase
MMTLIDFKKRYQWNPDENWIGGGGFGSVYKARDTMDNRRYVAVKVSEVKPAFGDYTLKREFELVKDLPVHRNIARYKECFRFATDTGVYDFAVLKYYESGNLEQFLDAQRKPLTEEEIYTLVDGILQGIYFLHQQGIIHRDIKAQNVLIDREDGIWVPKIADFGVSRASNMDISISRGMAISYPYAAPEQLPANDFDKNVPKIRSNVDLWAIGVMIYRIVAGVNPFLPPNHQMMNRDAVRIELIRRIWKAELPTALDAIPEPYHAIIRRCLVKDASKRVQDAGELLKLLNPDYKPKRIVIEGVTEKLPVVASKLPTRALLLGAGMALTLGLATFLYQQADKFSSKEAVLISSKETITSMPLDTNPPADTTVLPALVQKPILEVSEPKIVSKVGSKQTPVPPQQPLKPNVLPPTAPKVDNPTPKTEIPPVLSEEDNAIYDGMSKSAGLQFGANLNPILNLSLDCLDAGQFLRIKLIFNKLGQVESAELESNNLDTERDGDCIAKAKSKVRNFKCTAKKNGKSVRFSLLSFAEKK